MAMKSSTASVLHVVLLLFVFVSLSHVELEAFKPLTSVSDQAPFLGGPGNLTFTQCGGFRSLVNYAIKLSAEETKCAG